MKYIIITLGLLFSQLGFSQTPIENKTEMCEVLTEMRDEDQRYRKGNILGSSFGEESSYTKLEIDSVWALQIAIDNKNAEKLIQLTKQYGWLSDERIDCPKLNIWLIFRHSQEKYFKAISELIKTERAANRLNDFHYKLIKNHLDGRPKLED